MAVKFYLDKRPNKTTGEVHIRVSISVKGSRIISTVGHTIKPETWNSKNQRVLTTFKTVNEKGATPKIVNGRLKAIKAHFDEMDVRATAKPTIVDLKNELSSVTGTSRSAVKKEKEKSVLERFDEFIFEEAAANQWTDGTLQCWHAFRSHLQAQGNNLKFSFFNEDGINKLIEYLRKDCKMGENTVRKHTSNLKWFLRWAIRKGYSNERAIENYTPRFKVVRNAPTVLTSDELQLLYTFQIPDNGESVTLKRLNGEEYQKTVESSAALEKTRDLFCFCAFTSLRYSDMAKLKRTNIVKDKIIVTTKKTNDRLVIDLNEPAKAILNKYKSEKYPRDLALPVISNQKMNDYLKDLCEICGITEPVTQVHYKGGARIDEVRMKWELVCTHTARRTFISYALSRGIPPETVMKWTGHSDYKAMKPYIEIAEKEKERAMSTINEHLQKTLNDGRADQTTE